MLVKTSGGDSILGVLQREQCIEFFLYIKPLCVLFSSECVGVLRPGLSDADEGAV